MTQEEKQLLLKDLCGRLYLVKGLYQWKGNAPFDSELNGNLYDELYLSLHSTEDSSFKPYLRPLSSMTEEEKIELCILSYAPDEMKTIEEKLHVIQINAKNASDFYNAHHFDYRGLIEKGLAIEAPEGTYKNE